MRAIRTVEGLIDLARARQAILSVAQPGLGALLAAGGLPSPRVVVLGLIAATAGYLAVFSLNDVFDLKSDVEALEAGKASFDGFDIDTAFGRHPIAAGRLHLLIATAWVVVLASIAVVSAWLLNPWCVALFGLSVGLEAVYCALRSRTWTKTIISGVMVGAGGLAGWIAVAPLSARSVGFFAFLALWEIAGRNIPNDLADLHADRLVGLRTIPTTFGPVIAGRAIFGGALVVVTTVPGLGLATVELAFAFAASVVLLTLPSLVLLANPTPENASRYFNRASLLPALVFLIVLGLPMVGLD